MPAHRLSPSKSPMHYAHTDGGVSAIRCLDQSVDEPPDSPARAPRVGAFAAPTKASVASAFAVQGLSQSWQNSQRPKTFEHRLLLFLLTERDLDEDFLPLFASIAKFSAGLPQMFTSTEIVI